MRVARGLDASHGLAGPSWRARAISALVVTALGCAGAVLVPPAAAAVASSCAGGVMQIVAHQDDDLLFQSPDVLHDIEAGRCVRTVFLTAGDAGHGEEYWSGRELGSQAAYAEMAGVPDTWTTSAVEVAGRTIRVQSLVAAPQVSLVFMRLPDGKRRGSGNAVHHFESLMRLWQSAISSMSAIDGSASYDDAALRATLTALMVDFRPVVVRTQDWTAEFGEGDNADHIATARYVQAAQRDYGAAHTLLGYGGYPTWTRLPNVAGADLAAKQAAFHRYAANDSNLCLHFWCTDELVASLRLVRQYLTVSESSGNSARGVDVVATASSEDRHAGQDARKAVDGVPLGFPIDRSREWATVGGQVGSWIQLDLPQPTSVDGAVLADRPNLSDQVTGATLTFSDGSTVPIGPLANNGSAVAVQFAARTTTSVRLTVTSVSASTKNVGLAELETYATMGAGAQGAGSGAVVDSPHE